MFEISSIYRYFQHQPKITVLIENCFKTYKRRGAKLNAKIYRVGSYFNGSGGGKRRMR